MIQPAMVRIQFFYFWVWQQALFGHDIWGRSGALIDETCRRRPTINRLKTSSNTWSKRKARSGGRGGNPQSPLCPAGGRRDVWFYFIKKKEKEKIISFLERAGTSGSLALSRAGLHRVRFLKRFLTLTTFFFFFTIDVLTLLETENSWFCFVILFYKCTDPLTIKQLLNAH